jgi:hypothetical protein
MSAGELFPWFLLASSLAFVFILPLLSDGPPQPPSPRDEQSRARGTFKLHG